MDILEKCDLWAEQTYGEHLKNHYNDEGNRIIRPVLEELNLYNKKMTGKSIKYLPRTVEVDDDFIPRYSEKFNDMLKNDETVCDYIIKIMEHGYRLELDNEIIKGIIARGLRSFPSFLREQQFKKLLDEILTGREIEHNISSSLELDIKYHTDLLLKYDNLEFAIWLYQNSKTGIEKARKKILGKKGGKIRKGINVLCPIDVDSVHGDIFVRNEWSFYSEKYIWYILGMIELGYALKYKNVYEILSPEDENQIYYKKSFISRPRIFLKE